MSAAEAGPGMSHDAPPSAQGRLETFLSTFEGKVAAVSALAIAAHVVLRLLVPDGAESAWALAPLEVVVVAGGAPLAWQVMSALARREAGADLLAVISIVASVWLGEWLVAAILVLMMSGGSALESAASSRASATLAALARRNPVVGHRLLGPDLSSGTADVPAAEIAVDDLVAVFPHELCPVDGEVVQGHGTMDESYLTGEPYVVPKSVGSTVMSGAVNGESALVIRASAIAADSRFARIVGVLREAEEQRPPFRRLADRLGAWYTVLALTLAAAGWVVSGDPRRFLAVVVIATPCPLLIGVPVAIIGAISLAARRGIIVRNPVALEEVSRVRTVVFDKTGTLTYGRPSLTEVLAAPVPVGPGRQGGQHDVEARADSLLAAAAAVEAYSRHPLSTAVVAAAQHRGLALPVVDEVSERAGRGLSARVGGHSLLITNRVHAGEIDPSAVALLPPAGTGMECVVLQDGRYAATFRFRDEPRDEAEEFVAHLRGRHDYERFIIMSGDRASEVDYLAARVAITEVHAGVSPEEKLALVRERTAQGPTLFLGDGVNDAPAMTAATVGVAFGTASDVATEAADVVVLDSSMERLDDLIHIGRRMRTIALQSALGGIGLSLVGMVLAVLGQLTPLAGAVAQELIDLVAVLNAVRVVAVRGAPADFQYVPADTSAITDQPELIPASRPAAP
ncbi:MAG TPA: heavy metal translocating P-type ATPase [Dermatophilaceae bacterium]|nr:heavy metal translocating P-type ATPase [Dermatophilaceae bacterium]